ncbi:hypothetical protein RJT34_16639 [Clitoria ternatea]|uniref:Uncharacterized protein n=1 Tax=Clitoria ternatea TaxID=43366 RepID=A0AAN9PD11_CLITE
MRATTPPIIFLIFQNVTTNITLEKKIKAHCHHHWPTTSSPSVLPLPCSTLHRNYTMNTITQLYSSLFIHGFLTLLLFHRPHSHHNNFIAPPLSPASALMDLLRGCTLKPPAMVVGLGFEGCVLGLGMMDVDGGDLIGVRVVGLSGAREAVGGS